MGWVYDHSKSRSLISVASNTEVVFEILLEAPARHGGPANDELVKMIIEPTESRLNDVMQARPGSASAAGAAGARSSAMSSRVTLAWMMAVPGSNMARSWP